MSDRDSCDRQRSWAERLRSELAQKEQEQHGSDRGNDELPEQVAATNSQKAKERATQERSDDADDEVADEAVTAAFHDLGGEPAGRQTDQQEPEQIHGVH